MQSITFHQIDCHRPRPSAPVIALVTGLDGLLPESAQIGFAKADIDQKVAEVEIGLEIGSWLAGCPGVDGACAGREAIPASELSRAFRLIIHGGSTGDDAFDLGKLSDRSQVAEDRTQIPDQGLRRYYNQPYQAPEEPFRR
jgi:hypothetical protein